jgi:hypothetical protein
MKKIFFIAPLFLVLPIFSVTHNTRSMTHVNHTVHTSTTTHSQKTLVKTTPVVIHDRDKKHPSTHTSSKQEPSAMMHGMYGNYPSTRESSGTSWVPDSSQQEGFHIMRDDWMLMFGGHSYLVADKQNGKRGDKKIFDANMFMFMPQKDFDHGTFALRTMFSLEPFTIGKCGYPLLLQTGETCNGRTPLIDRQHPHDLFMELAAEYSYRYNPDTSAFLYFGLPGEPAMGPPVYIMRFSSEYIPETPLGHHWMDSTHISFGVLTAGYIHKGLKLEVSTFRGREPDQHRYDIEKPKFDSYSLRLSLNPTENWALQTSYGFLKSPEQLHPQRNTKKYTASAIYNKNFEKTTVQATTIIGINKETSEKATQAFLFEATLKTHTKHLVFSRFEWVKKTGLFCDNNPLSETAFNVKKLTLGYIYAFLFAHHLEWGVGGLIDFPLVPEKLHNYYGNTTSFMLFLQVRLL